MKLGEAVAGTFLALAFIAVSVVLLFVEPGMGFAGVADSFDPAKVLLGAASSAWLVGDLIYLGFGVALVYLAAPSDDRFTSGQVGWSLVRCSSSSGASVESCRNSRVSSPTLVSWMPRCLDFCPSASPR